MKKLIDSLETRKLLTEALERDVRSMHGRITLRCEPEDIDPADWSDLPDIVAYLRKQIASGNPWAWCYVTVTVHYGDYISSDSLGCCNYESESAFKGTSGYYDDMIRMCCVDLVAQLFAARETLDRLAALATPTLPEDPATDSE